MGGLGRFPSLGGSLLSLPYLGFLGLFFLLSSTHRESLSEVSRCRHAALDRILHRPTETYAVSAVSLSFLFSLFSAFVPSGFGFGAPLCSGIRKVLGRIDRTGQESTGFSFFS